MTDSSSKETSDLDNATFSTLVMEESEYSSNDCTFADEQAGVWLYQSNCLEFMDKVALKYPDGVFDMIFADPPYFLSNGGITCQAGKMVKVDKGGWDKSQGPEMNHEFNLSWLSRCQTLLKPNGSIWVSGTHHSIHSVGYAMQQLGMKILNDIVWQKPNPPPNLACRYFTHSAETIIWAAKNQKSKHKFDYPLMKEHNGGKQMKSVWNIKPPARSEKLFGKHPTQKPLELLTRIVQASTDADDFVFDPFSGSSTTGVACIEQGRRFVGCELDDGFIETSIQRMQKSLDLVRTQQYTLPKTAGYEMKEGGTGGANTVTGIHFEKGVDLLALFKKIPNYTVEKELDEKGKPLTGMFKIFFQGDLVARSFKQHGFYKFLDQEGVGWKRIVSKKLLPDDSLLVIVRKTLFIIEVKYQQVAGSVDEKLQTCDFKRKQYSKLVHSLGLKVEYVYVLNDWFRKKEYKDVLEYINSMNCHYEFGGLPLAWLGLPDGSEDSRALHNQI